jgi:F0F1-type ATP synthase membrane subunit b/b'
VRVRLGVKVSQSQVKSRQRIGAPPPKTLGHVLLTQTLFELKSWHLILMSSVFAAVYLFSDEMKSAAPELWRHIEPVVPLLQTALQFVPLVAVGLIWVTKKALDNQVGELQSTLEDVRTASEDLTSKSQTAAEGLSKSASLAEGELARATHVLGTSSSAAQQATDKVAAKLANTTSVLKNEIDRALDELRTLLENPTRLASTAVTSASPSPGNPENWQLLKEEWQDARNLITKMIEQIYETEDGRRTRHLELDYRNYGRVATELTSRDYISADASDSIIEMNAAFNRRKTSPYSTTAHDVARFRELKQQFLKAVSDRLTVVEHEPA